MEFLDVPDPTDFPPSLTAPGLRSLDGSFRCDICGELYDAPVTILCGHCFCSACIRTSLANKPECPKCRKACNEVHIRPNPILEKVIQDWQQSRPFILGLLKGRERPVEEQHSGASKKRKRHSPHASTPDVDKPQHPIFPASPSKRQRPTPKAESGAEEVTILSSDTDDEEPVNLPNSNPKGNDPVNCPICRRRMQFSKLNSHIDNQCKDPPSSRATAANWSKIMSGGKTAKQKGKHKSRGSDSDDEYPLPIQGYATLKDRQLKDMLLEHGLPVTGDRTNWEQRHQRWVTMYNANLDRSIDKRRTKLELRRELKSWEEDLTRRKKATDKGVVHDSISYQIAQKDEFAKLIEAARPRTERSSPPPIISSPAPAVATSLASSSSPPDVNPSIM